MYLYLYRYKRIYTYKYVFISTSLTHGSWSGNIVNRKPPPGGWVPGGWGVSDQRWKQILSPASATASIYRGYRRIHASLSISSVSISIYARTCTYTYGLCPGSMIASSHGGYRHEQLYMFMSIYLYLHMHAYTPTHIVGTCSWVSNTPTHEQLYMFMSIYLYLHILLVPCKCHGIWSSSHVSLDGYCSTLQALLDCFEVHLGFTELLLIISSSWYDDESPSYIWLYICGILLCLVLCLSYIWLYTSMSICLYLYMHTYIRTRIDCALEVPRHAVMVGIKV